MNIGSARRCWQLYFPMPISSSGIMVTRLAEQFHMWGAADLAWKGFALVGYLCRRLRLAEKLVLERHSQKLCSELI